MAIKKQEKLTEVLDTVVTVAGEMVEGKGEDCYCYYISENFGIMGVFDGCGGIGSRKYENYHNKSGAYIASRVTARQAKRWFREFCEKNESELSPESLPEICAELKSEFKETLKKYESGAATSAMKGSLTRSFPTTASILLFTPWEQGLFTSFIWAGDSRGFILDSKGLSQMTKDDIEGDEDAMSNLSADGRLSNMVSATGDFVLNYRGAYLGEPTLIITATDGCFGYFSTPMEFEYMLLETMMEAENAKQWEENIRSVILKFTGDDYSLGIVLFGYKSFKALKKSYEVRKNYLFDNYISKLPGASEDELAALWDSYQKNYYRGN